MLKQFALPWKDGVAAYLCQDYAAALAMWRPLAEQGVARAQHLLGHMYANGESVPQDYVLAHMWFNLAAAQGDADAGRPAAARAAVAEKMTPDQIAEAQRLAREWKPTPAQ